MLDYLTQSIPSNRELYSPNLVPLGKKPVKLSAKHVSVDSTTYLTTNFPQTTASGGPKIYNITASNLIIKSGLKHLINYTVNSVEYTIEIPMRGSGLHIDIGEDEYFEIVFESTSSIWIGLNTNKTIVIKSIKYKWVSNEDTDFDAKSLGVVQYEKDMWVDKGPGIANVINEDYYYVNDTYITAGNSWQFVVSKTGKTWKSVADKNGTYKNAIHKFKDMYLLPPQWIPNQYQTRMWYSKDAYNWEYKDLVTVEEAADGTRTNTYNPLTSSDSVCLMGGYNNYWRTEDGINWTEYKWPSTYYWCGPQWINDRFVVYSYQQVSTYLWSTDGINWTESPVDSSLSGVTWSGFRNMEYKGGRYFMGDQSSSGWTSSTDGIVWTTPVSLGFGDNIRYGNGCWIRWPGGGYTRALYKTLNGSSWNHVKSAYSGSEEFMDCSYACGTWLVLREDGLYYTKDNFTTLTSTSLTGISYIARCWGYWVATSSSAAYYSFDGINWISSTNIPTLSYSAGASFVSVGGIIIRQQSVLTLDIFRECYYEV